MRYTHVTQRLDPVANPEDIVLQASGGPGGSSDSSTCNVGGADLCTKKVSDWTPVDVLAWGTGLFSSANLDMAFLTSEFTNIYSCGSDGSPCGTSGIYLTGLMICAKEKDVALELHEKIDANFLGASASGPTPAPIHAALKPGLKVGMPAWADRLFTFSDMPMSMTGAVLYQLPYSLGDGTVITFDFTGKPLGTLYVLMRKDFDGGLKNGLMVKKEWKMEGEMPSYLDDGEQKFDMLSMKTSTDMKLYTLRQLVAEEGKKASVVFAWKPNVAQATTGAASVASAPSISVVANSYLKSTSLWLIGKHTALTNAFADLTSHCGE
jgi:hypothetical protein